MDAVHDRRFDALKHSHARLAAWMLRAIAMHGGALTMTEQAIADRCGVSRRTVARALPQLKRADIIAIRIEHGKTNTYYAIEPVGQEHQP